MSPTPFLGALPQDFTGPQSPAAAILPVPYDETSTWMKGADRGPAAILEASAQVELYDIETGSEPFRRGIATLPALAFKGPPEELAEKVEAEVASIFTRGQVPVILGGEHSVTIGAVRAAAQRFERLTVLQIDAHGDTREEYEGSACNHACVMARARQWAEIVQVGIRAIDAAEAAKLAPGRVFFAHDVLNADAAGTDWMKDVVKVLSDHIYLTIDVDGFDPGFFPATGTPEPGGLSWRQVNELVKRVARHKTIVGFDVVELLPTPGLHHCQFTAAKLVYRILAEIFANQAGEP